MSIIPNKSRTWPTSAHTASIPLLIALLVLIGCTRSSRTSSLPGTNAAVDSIQFNDVTARSALDDFRHATGAFGKKWFPETVGSGGGFIDYNGDGWLDILLVGGGVWEQSPKTQVQALRLYRNNGDKTFTEVTEAAGLDSLHAYGFGISVADYDNDGDDDFFFTTLHENTLFENRGGTFTDVTDDVDLGNTDEWSTSAIFFDADNDGHLDLYVGNYVEWSPEIDKWCTVDGETKEYCTPDLYEGTPGRYYHNDGDGTFSDRTKAAGFLPAPGNTFGVAALDYNRDGYTDLAVANDLQRNLLYRNNGDGTFTERGTISGIAYGKGGKVRAGMGIDAGYVTDTGQPSVVVGNFANEMIGVFRHTGDGLFIDRASVSNIGDNSLRTLTFGLFLFDPKLDGDLDLFAANGHIKPGLEKIQNDIHYEQLPQLYLNDGNGSFIQFEPRSGVLSRRYVARGAAHGDIDRDGDPDILMTENGGPAHLWENTSQVGNYLHVVLQGKTSNAEGIGSRLRAVIGRNELTRFMHTGSSYLSHSETSVTFGLGESSEVDSLIIHWPSGKVDRFTDVAANQHIRIREGSSSLETVVAANGTN